MAVSLAALLVAVPAQAETPAPSTVSMLEAMVAAGVLTQEKAQSILADAKARDAARAEAETPPPLPDGAKRVAYVPEIVKQELREEIRRDVMAKAKAENWAAPNSHPEWTERITFTGDLRSRYEGTYFPDGNATGQTNQIDFGDLNSGSPLDLADTTALSTGIPYRNADQNRSRLRLRARLGVTADLGEGFSSGLRIATGSGSAPVSTNQTLGGSGGNFSKYQLWLDRGFVRWDAMDALDGVWGLDKETAALGIDLGRFDNPFFSTDLIWDGDLGFDGVAVGGSYEVAEGITPFLTAGAFPVHNTDFDLSSTNASKTASRDKWLYGVQGGTDWKPSKTLGFKAGAAYYHFKDMEGERADCSYLLTTCASDSSRPAFAQTGNTYMALRNNIGRTAATDPDYQYYGLATPFHELALTGRVDYDGFGAVRLTVDGEFVKNLAFDENEIQAALPENNTDGTTGLFDGGDTGYLLRLTVGSPALRKRWDWQTSLAYKYVETDAVVDGLTDSDFGLGGTNLKGFLLGGDLALARNVSTSLRWMSADNIASAPFSVDTVQVDLKARF
jgi:hypothetical protein